MKDATGELSMTAVAVVAIAGIAGLFTTFVWPQIRTNIQNNTRCSQAISCECTAGSPTCSCTYLREDGTPDDVTCPNESAAQSSQG